MKHLLKKAAVGATMALTIAAMGVTAFAGQIGTVTAGSLNVRDGASTSAAVITQIYNGGQVKVIDSTDGWYKVSFGYTEGWVSADYLSVTDDSGNQIGTISGNNVNVRTGPSTGNDVVLTVVSGEKVSILGNDNGWYKVEFSTGVIGWVKGDYVSTGSGDVASRGGSLGSQIVSFAQKYIGTPYAYGGSSASGVDCSGFVKLVFNNYGIYVNRVAADQATQGTYVSTSNLAAGDLVFFATDGPGYISHVGIYIGNGQFIHASSGSAKSVTISSIWDSYYSGRYVTARRLTR